MKSVIEDIFELRKEKLMKFLKAMTPETPVKFLSSVGCVELNACRPGFISGYNVADKMQ
jgi:hypothetical protein